MSICRHCNKNIQLNNGDELLLELQDSVFICPECGFPTTVQQESN